MFVLTDWVVRWLLVELKLWSNFLSKLRNEKT